VEAGLDHPAEEAGTGAHADQAVEGHGVARMGRRLVVGPGAAAQLLQAGDAAVVVDDHIGVVDGPATVALTGQHRGGQRLHRRRVAVGQPDIGQPADHPEVGFASFELVEGGPDDQFERTPETVPDPLGQGPVDGQHVGGQEGREPRSAIAASDGHRLAADGSVSYMRMATTRPEAAVRAATTKTAATRPASSAPTAKPASRHNR
jgi:hypothetical protein